LWDQRRLPKRTMIFGDHGAASKCDLYMPCGDGQEVTSDKPGNGVSVKFTKCPLNTQRTTPVHSS
jgi:hypothetical protein